MRISLPHLLLTGLIVFAAQLPTCAKAAIVYVDFNNNPDERAQILKSAKKDAPNESVFLIPNEDRAGALNLQKLTDERDKIWVQYTKKSCSAELACQALPTGECLGVYQKLRSFEDAAAQAPKTMLTLAGVRASLQDLDDSLRQMPEQKRNQESITVVLSGHYGGGVFTGNLGSFSVDELTKVFQEFPEIQRRVVRLYLLGCYTNTFPQVKTVWRSAFANAKVLVGFFAQSPRGESPQNLELIATLIKNRKVFDQIANEKQFASAMKVLRGFRDLSVALCVDDFYQQAGSSHLLLVSQQELKANSCRTSLTPEEVKYFQAVKAGDQPLPFDTSHSQLRSYYTALRDHSNCLDNPVFTAIEPDAPNPEQVIRLILYRTVVTNFENLNRNDLANFDLLLKSVGVEPALWSQSVNLGDRKALNGWIKALQTRLGAVTDRNMVNKILDLLRGLSDTVVELRNNCVPFTWVEPGAQEPSSCFRVAGACGA